MSQLAFTRSGVGSPLVLLHGIGLSRRTWDPVIPSLARNFDVIAVDLPGFGESKPLPAHIEPVPATLAMAVAELLDDLGVAQTHLVGNSLGGWVALELASVRPTSSLTLLSPAGMWRSTTPRYCRASVWMTRWLSQHATELLSRLMTYRLARALVLGQSHGRPMHLTPGYARDAIHAMGSCPGFDATMKATTNRRFLATGPITAPVTVAFGSRDLILLPNQSRFLDQLPPRTRVEELPACGHIPMSDDASAVADLIRRSATAPRLADHPVR